MSLILDPWILAATEDFFAPFLEAAVQAWGGGNSTPGALIRRQKVGGGEEKGGEEG